MRPCCPTYAESRPDKHLDLIVYTAIPGSLPPRPGRPAKLKVAFKRGHTTLTYDPKEDTPLDIAKLKAAKGRRGTGPGEDTLANLPSAPHEE